MNDNTFDHRFAFKTKGGWPARLLGVLDRPAFPLVVAIQNPAFGMKEQLCMYALDGRTPTTVTDVNTALTEADELEPEIGCKDGMLSLVNLLFDEEHNCTDPVHAVSVGDLDPIPPLSNPFHHDSFRMGSTLVRGWMVMHDGYDSEDRQRALNEMILINTRSGQRIRLALHPVKDISNDSRI